MAVLITCKHDEYPIKSVHRFLRRSRAAYSEIHGRIWPNLELILTLMVVLITYKNEEDPIRNEGDRVLTTFSPL